MFYHEVEVGVEVGVEVEVGVGEGGEWIRWNWRRFNLNVELQSVMNSYWLFSGVDRSVEWIEDEEEITDNYCMILGRFWDNFRRNFGQF